MPSTPDPDLDDGTVTPKPRPDDVMPDSHCPWCGQPVGKDCLQDFASGFRMTLSAQQDFCDKHKKEEARIEWEERGYPEIDWTVLNKRISSHCDRLEGMLEDKLTQDIKNGKAWDVLSPSKYVALHGYYGTRGVRAIEDVSARFSGLFRQLQGKLAFRGSFFLFIHDVLVPELLVRLVMEDMMLDEDDEEGARGILEASQELGALLCEEEEDVVDPDDPDSF